MKASNEKRLFLGLIAAFAGLCFVAFLLLGSASEQKKTSDWVTHTREVLAEIASLISSLRDAENGRRGYILSGEDRYLGHFTNAVWHAELTVRKLRTLTRDNPSRTAVCDRLEELMRQRLSISTNSIHARKANGLNIPEQMAFIERGQEVMELIRGLADKMSAEENILLKERQERRNKNQDDTGGFAILLALMSLIGFAMLMRLLVKANRRRLQAERSLAQTNSELERRVEERTSELTKAVEKAAWLATFPEENPNPIVEIEPETGVVPYQNPFAKQAFPKLERDRFDHPFLRGLKQEAALLLERKEEILRREVYVEETCYAQTISYIPSHRRLRVYSNNVTDRKRAQEKLREGDRRFRTLVESLPQLVWTSGTDGSCDYLSRQWVEYTEQAASEQLGFGWLQHVHPIDRERVKSEWAAAIANGNNFDTECRIRRSDGVYRWFKTRAMPLRNAQGEIIKWFGAHTDFEDYKRSEQKLQTQLGRLDLLHRIARAIGERQDLRSIFQVVVATLEKDLPVEWAAIYVADGLGKKLTLTSLGPKSSALSSGPALDENSPIDIESNSLSLCLQGRLIYEPDILQVRGTFTERLAQTGLRSIVICPLIIDGKTFGVLVVARGVVRGFNSSDCEFLQQLSEHVSLAAHQTKLYGALQQAYEELRQTQQAVMQHERLRVLGQMASGIAHDINNALSPAALYTQNLLEREPNLSHQAREYLRTIGNAIDDVTATISRLREFYRQREEQLVLAPVDLNRVMEQVMELTRARWNDIPQQLGLVIDLKTELSPQLPVIMAVESELRGALTNLIFNAVDAMPGGGTLTLKTGTMGEAGGAENLKEAAAPQTVYVEVQDTGVGMNDDTRRKCLEPFFTTKGERGTGLGLAMVYGVVQRHSAQLEIESALGKGTTIRLKFSASNLADTRVTEIKSSAALPAKTRILLVDDDPILLKSMRDILEADGHKVTTASNGESALQTFKSREKDKDFGVIITDLGMPQMDGRRLASLIKEVSPSTPVILLTGWGQRLMAEGDILGVDRVLAKPPKLSELREAISGLATLQVE